MRPAREVACEFYKCSEGTHWPGCHDLTSLLEADRRELVEAAAKLADATSCCQGGLCGEIEGLAMRIRRLIPKEDSRG